MLTVAPSSSRRMGSSLDLFSAMEIQDYDLRRDGHSAICSVNRGNNWELARIDLRSGQLRKFLSSEQSMQMPDCSPVDDSVVLQSDFEGDENHDIVLATANGKARRKVTDGVADNQSPRFSPDGRSIAFISNRRKDIENLYIVDTMRKRIRALTTEDLPVKEFAWSPDGTKIAYATGVGHLDYISMVEVGKARTRKILSSKHAEYWLSAGYGTKPAPWSSDGERLLFISNENDTADIGEISLSTKKTKWLVVSKNDKCHPQWSPSGHALAYIEIRDPNAVVIVRRRSSGIRISRADGVSRALSWTSQGDSLTFVNGSATRPEELLISKAKTVKRVSRFQKTPFSKTLLVRPKLVHYESFDGRKIAALLHMPRNRKRRAGIVLPHGGPEAQSLNIWDQLPHMLAAKGFTVIEPNYRGSTGYGREFLHLHNRDLGGGDLKDTIYAGRYLVVSGLAKSEKLGYWGASYGGFLCLLALTKAPEMWAAGVSVVGFFDWETEMANERGYLKAYDRTKMGDPKKEPELFHERSPINFLDRLRAPLLLVASARDARCPPTESRAVVRRLQKMGKSYEYHEYPDEGHWPRKRKNLKDLFLRTTDFLDKNISK